MVLYTQKWHHRTLEIVDHAKEARSVYSVAWNSTQDMIAALNVSVSQRSDKTSFKLANLAQLFASESQWNVEKIGPLAKDSTKAMHLFIGIPALELALVVLFFYLVHGQKIREKLFLH
jgi:hypothetical protein